ncbi:uncharacterized protein LOC135930015 isoform X2 [Gordionus sp. m RMFG-2023]|uniref:uncharacterized protein LOC135930015 isoform X2 n=1 Tax=Gordionus sp. m RMFG-2023 TaxID=3053472 RepID=UPI0031FCE83A
MSNLTDLEKRLHDLRGMKLNHPQTPEDLIKQTTQLIQLENKLIPDLTENQIRERLKRLRECGNFLEPSGLPNNDLPTLTEEEETDQIVSNIIKEVEIENAMAKYQSSSEPSLSQESKDLETDDDIKICELCPHLAVIICLDCENKYYCSVCYDDYHDSGDFFDHKIQFF